MKKIKITDITLKKLSQDREANLLFREKTAIASCADSLGADAIELAPITKLREDTIIYKTIAQKLQNAVLAIPVGFTAEDVNNAWESIKEAKMPRLQVEVPVSTVQMEYTYHIKAEKMLIKIAELIKNAKELCADVEFSALDATRADEDFLIAAVKEAEVNGATMVTICDDAGVTLPEGIAALVEKVKTAVSIPVYVQVSDHINMAVASAVAAITKNVDGLKCAMAGKDVLLAGKLSDAITTCSAEIGAETNIKNTKIHASIDDLLNSINHEEYDAASTVSEKKKILLDSDTTIAQVAQAAQVLGYDISDADA